MLKAKELHAYYGPIEALKGIDIEVGDSSIVCLIGSNGAGKTTLLKAISGMVKRTGAIEWNGEKISESNSISIAKRRILHVPEGRHVFPGLTVKENLEIGSINWHGFFGRKSFAKELEEIYNLFPRLEERKNQLAWSLSGGEQQMLAIGRALMGRPNILMLDEPSMGLAPVVVDELFHKIVEINKRGIPILLVEQNARLAMEVSDYTYVIDQGQIPFSGPSKELRNDPRVVESYLGKLAKKSLH